MPRAVSLLSVIAAFSLTSCAKQESTAERNAEIDRRVNERLAAEHQAAEGQRLAQRQAELQTREKALAAQENSFATLMASLPPETAANPADDAGADAYSATYPDAASQVYPDDYGYVPNEEPYLAVAPYYFIPTPAYVTVIQQNSRIVYPRRHSARGGREQAHRGVPPVMPRPPTVPRPTGTSPRPTVGRPMPTMTHRPTQVANPTRAANPPQVVNRRPGSKVAPQPNR